jgi:Mg2+ and Co2+ transporter CorA
MHELFMFAAFSESQFLNLVASKLESELEHSALVWQKSAALSNLVYHQQILDRHIHQLRENLASVDEAIGSYLQHDLQPDNNKLPPALAAAKRLRTDYQSLVDRASKLLRYCDRGVQIVMNNAMIKESREAIHQAKGVVKLTRLAFVFIPLSFTTSFFGMNFKQLNSEALGIWIWFVVSLPILAMAVLLMQYDVSLIWHSRKRDARSTTKLSPHAAVHEV